MLCGPSVVQASFSSSVIFHIIPITTLVLAAKSPLRAALQDIIIIQSLAKATVWASNSRYSSSEFTCKSSGTQLCSNSRQRARQ
ncbi:hypothetical protein EDC01DRAFT_274050 [Geopyxis carbonaria]|nr:hypothetical protein EDC01DRAFT_274050 [Geopyxis carbonaria]